MAPHESEPDAAAFAEVHALWEPPFVYLYHTLRYQSAIDVVEDLGVQMLALQRLFKLTLPLLVTASVEPGATVESATVSLATARTCVLTVAATYPPEARTAPVVRVRASRDGMAWDMEDWAVFALPLRPEEMVRESFSLPAGPRSVKCLVTGDNEALRATSLRLGTTLGG